MSIVKFNHPLASCAGQVNAWIAPVRFRRCGLTLLELLVCIAILLTVIALTLAAVQRTRESAARLRCADQLRQLGLALQSYHQSQGAFPCGVSSGASGYPYPFMSWHVRLLPYLERGSMWLEAEEAFKKDPVFWNNPPHTGLATVVPGLICPSDGRIAAPLNAGHDGGLRAFTSYLGVEGTNAGLIDGILYLDSRSKLGDITDGTSNTLIIGERPPSADLELGWWYAGWGQRQNGDGDMVLGVRSRNYGGYGIGCPEGPFHFTPGDLKNQCDAFHFWSPHSGGANFAFADGSVRFLNYSADSIVPALATRAGGEAVELP